MLTRHPKERVSLATSATLALPQVPTHGGIDPPGEFHASTIGIVEVLLKAYMKIQLINLRHRLKVATLRLSGATLLEANWAISYLRLPSGEVVGVYTGYGADVQYPAVYGQYQERYETIELRHSNGATETIRRLAFAGLPSVRVA